MQDNAKLVKTILLTIFFFSGLCALVYQIVWIRMLGQVFGLTIFAVSTVLTTYMAGLALGSFFFGKLIDKHEDHLFIFTLLELGIGIFALLFPVLLKFITGIYISLTQTVQPNLYINSIFRFAVSFNLLLFPTILMGGTLPVLSKYYIKRLNLLGEKIGNLYSINNLGSIFGCFLASFFLIQIVGLSSCIYIASFINIFIAITVFIIRKKAFVLNASNTKEAKPAVKTKDQELNNYSSVILRLVLWVFAIEGFTTLSYEVIWTRILLGISYDRSVYFYSTVILAFISGLSFGSFIVARFIDRKRNLVFILGIIEVIIGISACAVLLFFVQISGYLNTVRPHYKEPWLFSLGKEYLIFFLMMIVPTTLMGTTFPIVAKIYTTSIKKLGRKIGIIGCLDTIGSIFGSFAAGFILIPFIGVVNALIFTAVINILIGIMLIIFNPHSKFMIKALSIATTAGIVVVIVVLLPHKNYFKHWQTEEEGDRLLFYKEGLGSTVAVSQKFDGVKELAIDGAVTAIAEYGDIRVHKLLGYIPYLLCKNPEKALVVGFGMGITAQSLIQDNIKEVTCVEICTEIVNNSSTYFLKENKNVLKEHKLRVIVEDGRSYIATTRNKYDIITTNAVHPRLSINIYTKEFYELCKSRLTQDGVMCQWMATNWLSEFEYKMLLKSFIEVFPNTSLWISNIGHVILLGTPNPLRIDFKLFKQKLGKEKIRSDLKEVHLDNPFAFLAHFACGASELEIYLNGTQPNTDNYPVPEFSKYISMSPNLKTIDRILSYKRDIGNIVFNWSDEDEIKEMEQYIDAERYFLKARYADFKSPGSNNIEYLKKVVCINPYNFMFRRKLGQRYSEIGEYKMAEMEYKNEIDLDRDNPLGYTDLAYVYFKLDKYDDAILSAKRALEIDQENGLAHYLLSIIYRINTRFEEASKELEIVVKSYPSFKNALFELGETYFVMGRYKEAKAAFADYSQSVRNNKEAEMLLDRLKKMGY